MDFYRLTLFFGFILLIESFPQQGFNTDSAQDPNSVDDAIGWSWGVSDNSNRNTNSPVNQPPGTLNPQRQTPNGASSGGPIVNSVPYLRCLADCPTTSEYNPICGSDMQSYHNMAKFGCAVSCGARIRVHKFGTCLPVNG